MPVLCGAEALVSVLLFGSLICYVLCAVLKPSECLCTWNLSPPPPPMCTKRSEEHLCPGGFYTQTHIYSDG